MGDEKRRTKDVLSPLIRGGSKAGFYLTEHKDTKTQSLKNEGRKTNNEGRKTKNERSHSHGNR